MRTAADLLFKALNLSVEDTVPAKRATHCRFCGVSIAVGDAVKKHKLPNPFTDAQDLFSTAKTHEICPSCAPFLEKRFMVRLKKCLITAKGAYQVTSKGHRTEVLLNPPEPPFAWLHFSGNMRHMVWRTPISYSKDFFSIYLFDSVQTVRRPFVVGAADLIRNAELPAKTKPHYFLASQDPDMNDLRSGQMRYDLRQAYPAVSELISQMTVAELWAFLTLLLERKEPEPLNLIQF